MKKEYYIILGFAWETDSVLGHTYAEIVKIQKSSKTFKHYCKYIHLFIVNNVLR